MEGHCLRYGIDIGESGDDSENRIEIVSGEEILVKDPDSGDEFDEQDEQSEFESRSEAEGAPDLLFDIQLCLLDPLHGTIPGVSEYDSESDEHQQRRLPQGS